MQQADLFGKNRAEEERFKGHTGGLDYGQNLLHNYTKYARSVENFNTGKLSPSSGKL